MGWVERCGAHIRPAFLYEAAVPLLLGLAYWPNTSGAAITARWGVLFVAAAIMLPQASEWRKLPWPLTFFFLYAALSLCWSPFRLDGAQELLRYAVLLPLAYTGARATSCDIWLCSATCGMAVNSLLCVAQYSGYSPVLQVTPHPAGLFLNANMMAEAATLVAVGLLFSPSIRYRWLFLFAVLPAALLPLHRTSILVLLIAATIYSARQFGWIVIAGAGLATVIGTVGFLFLPTTLQMSVMPSFASFEERLMIWQATVSGLTLLGHGAGSFRGLFPFYAGQLFDPMMLWPLHAHNDGLEWAFEYGAVGLVPIGFLLYCSVAGGAAGALCAAALVLSLAEFPLFMPFPAAMVAFAAGHALRSTPRVPGLRAVLLRWRILLLHRVAEWRRRSAEAGASSLAVRHEIS